MIDRMAAPLARERVARPRKGVDPSEHAQQDGAPVGAGASPAVLAARVAAAAENWGLPAIAGIVLGRASVFGAFLPFGTAFCIALAAQGRARRALAAAAGAALGVWTSPAAPAAAGGLVAAVLPLVGVLAAASIARSRRRPAWMTALAASLVVAGARVLAAVAAAAVGSGDLLTAGIAGAAEIAAAQVLLPAGGMTGARAGALSHGHVVSGLALVGIGLLGLNGVAWNGFALVDLLSRIVVLLAALVGGPGFGAAAGAACGLVAFLAGAPVAGATRVAALPAWGGAVLPAAGLLAGLGALAGRAGAALGLIVAHVLLAPVAGTGTDIGQGLFHSLAAALLLALVPASVLRDVAARLPGTPERERLHRQDRREAHARAEQQLQRVAAVFAELSQTFATQATADEDDPLERFLARVSEGVCRDCSQFSLCWERQAQQMCRDLTATAAAAGAEGQVSVQDLPPPLRQRCLKPPHLARGVSRVLEAMRTEFYWRTRLEASRELVPRQLSGIAAIIAGVADQMERSDPLAASYAEQAWAPRFDLEVSVLQTPPEGEIVSGDCFRRVDLSPTRVALILSDGMGTGERAAAESQAAVAMLQRFLEAGFDLEFSVNTINSVLLLRSSDETYATLDACVVDLADGTVQMLKVGAAPSFVRRGGEVEVVRAVNVPVGILARVETEVVIRRLDAGDMVVMVTDGALAACRARGDAEETVRRTVARIDPPDAGRLVDLLGARLRSRTTPAADDVTIVAFQLTERGRRVSRSGGRPAGEAVHGSARR